MNNNINYSSFSELYAYDSFQEEQKIQSENVVKDIDIQVDESSNMFQYHNAKDELDWY